MRYFTRVPFGLVLLWKALGALVVVVGLLVLFVKQQLSSGADTRRQSTAADVRTSTALSDMTLVPDASAASTTKSFRFAARLKNESQTKALSSIRLRLRLSDCPANATTCDVVGEEIASFKVHVPPGQVRGIESRISFPNLPVIRHGIAWEAVLVEATGN